MLTPPAPWPIVYLDNSALGRLTDPAPGVPITGDALRRIVTDALHVDLILGACRTGRLSLLWSEALEFETLRAPAWVRLISRSVLPLAPTIVSAASTRALARILQAGGFREFDALHVAAAYTGRAAYLVSCDDHFLRRTARVTRLLGPGPAIVSPGDCLRREGLQR